MKNIRRALSALLAVWMVISLFAAVVPFAVSAAETNVAKGKPVTAAGSNPGAITNGNTGDYWDGGAYPQSAIIIVVLQLDLRLRTSDIANEFVEVPVRPIYL